MSAEHSVDPEDVRVAAKVILHAGNARALVCGAFQDAEKGDVEAAGAKLGRACEEISAAHSTQTNLIQAEARGESVPLSLLFTHAQDTLMAAISEANMARQLLGLYTRLHALEKQAGRRQ